MKTENKLWMLAGGCAGMLLAALILAATRFAPAAMLGCIACCAGGAGLSSALYEIRLHRVNRRR